MKSTVFAIGQEGAAFDEVVIALQRAGVRRVVDVRVTPLSRRPGVSRTSLAATMTGESIEYVHLNALGTRKAGHDAAKKGDVRTLHAVNPEQLELPEAQV